MKKLTLTSLALTLALPASVFAQPTAPTPPQTPQWEDMASIAISDDLYAAGGDVYQQAAVEGDSFAAGGTVYVNETVGGDLHVAGGTVVVDAAIGDDARLVGGTITLSAPVQGDVIILGGKIHITKEANIGGDLYVQGGKVQVEGTVRGMTRIQSEDVRIEGTLNGPSEVRAVRAAIGGQLMSESRIAAQHISVGENAMFGGNLRYWQVAGPLQLGTKAKGQAVYDLNLQRRAPQEAEKSEAAFAGMIAAFSLFSLLSTALLIAVLLLLTKTFFKESAKKMLRKPGTSFLRGLLYFIVTPIVAFLLLITIIGIPLAAVVGLHFVIAIIFAKALTAITWVRYFELRNGKAWGWWTVFGLSIAAFIVLKLLSIIPIIGWLACAVLTCMAFGALMTTKWERVQKVL